MPLILTTTTAATTTTNFHISFFLSKERIPCFPPVSKPCYYTISTFSTTSIMPCFLSLCPPLSTQKNRRVFGYFWIDSLKKDKKVYEKIVKSRNLVCRDR
jgi:hypothetical protein